MSKKALLLIVPLLSLTAPLARAGVVLEFDAGNESTPLLASPPWTQKGEPMENQDGKLVQHTNSLTEEGTSSYYISPPLDGLILDGKKDYGIEFRVHPVNDIKTAGNSTYANLMVGWSDQEHSYDLSIDRSSKDEPDGPGETSGDLNGGENRLAKVAEGIDWSKAHTIFIGYKASDKSFTLYVDGEKADTFPVDQISFDPTAEFADHVVFGDATSGQGGDVRAEWSFLRVHDVSTPTKKP